MDVIKIGQHIIAALQLEKPKAYRDILRILGKNEIIPLDLGERIEKMGGFRIILAHGYERVAFKEVYELHLRTSDFEDFIFHVTRFLDTQQKRDS